MTAELSDPDTDATVNNTFDQACATNAAVIDAPLQRRRITGLETAMAKERRFARRQPARRVLSARLRNPAAYPLRASLSFRNDPGHIAARKSPRQSRS